MIRTKVIIYILNIILVLHKLKIHITKINKVLEDLEKIPEEIETTDFSKL